MTIDQRTIALILEYDGTAFAGSQYQVGARTVQGELERVWRQFTGESVRWTFAGRTDSGVHARGQVAHVRTGCHHSIATVQRALNALLPPDLGVRAAWEAPATFHARFSARQRDYRYLILNGPWPAPLLRLQALHIADVLNVEAMDQAVRWLEGEHDFAAFGSVEQGTTVRNCFRARCRARDEEGRRLVEVELSANGFLRHMVRSIVGTLLLVGRNKITAEDVRTILASRVRAAAGPTAPPHGLYLEAVRYAGDDSSSEITELTGQATAHTGTRLLLSNEE